MYHVLYEVLTSQVWVGNAASHWLVAVCRAQYHCVLLTARWARKLSRKTSAPRGMRPPRFSCTPRSSKPSFCCFR
jgi:hypothetical protein